MYCWKCGREISETAEFCPYCGTAQRIHAQAPGMSGGRNNVKAEPDYYTLSIVGFALSCISVACSMGGLMPVAGLVVSVIALVKINKTLCGGKGFAIAGIVIGGLVLLVSALIFFSVLRFGFGMMHGFWEEFFPVF